MPRLLSASVLFLAATAAFAQDGPLLQELGLVSSRQVDKAIYQVTEWRFKDVTGALAGSFAIPKATRVGNYVLTCDGQCPKQLPAPEKVRNGAVPVLQSYLPQKRLKPESERYVLGPVGLSQSALEIPAFAAAFQFGTEAVVGKYRVGQNEATLAIFMYPIPQMARQQLPEFQKVKGATVKRSGPLVGVVLHAPDEAFANALLKEIEYQASISWDEKPPLVIPAQTVVQIVLGATRLAGAIIVFCFLSGLAYGGIRVLRRKFGDGDAGDAMITLHLTGN